MKVDAILTADLHIRGDVPISRTDDFLQAQVIKLEFIKKLAEKHDCPVLIAGDIFNKAKSNPYEEAIAIQCLPDNCMGVPGQHDLPAHNISDYKQSSLHVLESAGKIDVLMLQRMVWHSPSLEESILIYGFPFGITVEEKEEKCEVFQNNFKIALIHQMIHKDHSIHQEVESTSGLSLLKRTNFDLIVSGDNHQPFTVRHKGKLLVNCGSMMRTTAAQMDYRPAVWLWNREKNEVEPAYLPIEENVLSREHLDKKEKEDLRLSIFVDKIDSDFEIGISFKDNLEAYYYKNKTRKGVKEEVYEGMES